MRTLSKFGLAGVRIGYMIGPKALVAEIDKVRPPYNISVLNCETALFALEHESVFAAQATRPARGARSRSGGAGRPAGREELAQRRQHDPGARAATPKTPSRA